MQVIIDSDTIVINIMASTSNPSSAWYFFNSKDIFDNRVVHRYMQRYIKCEEIPPVKLQLLDTPCKICAITLALSSYYGGKICDTYDRWMINFNYVIFFLPYVRSCASLLAGVYIDFLTKLITNDILNRVDDDVYNIMVKLVGIYNIVNETEPPDVVDTVIDILIDYIDPDAFMVHAIYKSCRFQPDTLIHSYNILSVISYINNVFATFLDSQADSIGGEDFILTDVKDLRSFIRTQYSKIDCQNSGGHCLDHCSSMLKDFKNANKRIDSTDIKAFVKEQQQIYNGVSDSYAVLDTQWLQNENDIDNEYDNTDGYIQLQVVRKMCLDNNPYSVLNMLRFDQCHNIYINHIPTEEIYRKEDCVLCNMMCAADFYRTIKYIIDSLTNKTTSGVAVDKIAAIKIKFQKCREQFRLVTEQDDIDGKFMRLHVNLFRFLFEDVGANAFIYHMYSNPLCTINQMRFDALYTEGHNENVCGKSIQAAFVYCLYVYMKSIDKERRDVKLTSRLDVTLSSHNIKYQTFEYMSRS